jgi:EAL domain-containing protein (putative c-di-GMP-specific phosphodiesterase class I)
MDIIILLAYSNIYIDDFKTYNYSPKYIEYIILNIIKIIDYN